jgi:hypothetical protein
LVDGLLNVARQVLLCAAARRSAQQGRDLHDEKMGFGGVEDDRPGCGAVLAPSS